MVEPPFDARPAVDRNAANAPKAGGDPIWLARARAFAGPPCLSGAERRREEREEGRIPGAMRANPPPVPIAIGAARHG